MERIKVISPCSSANLGSGFDVFGLALEAFRDTLTVELTDGGITVEVAGLDTEKIPADLDKKTAGFVAKKLLADRQVGDKIRLEKGIPPKMGLGYERCLSWRERAVQGLRSKAQLRSRYEWCPIFRLGGILAGMKR